MIAEQGGWLTNGWAKDMAKKIQNYRNKTHNRLAEIAFAMLQKFDLPISSSTELMNRVLTNLVALNMSF